ncbi:hypothetical protein QQY66_05295 [Streptomyces sp. DG2A-72]|uniref:hypothetical protein n=1 Tax=Streptomyces sp. DG2A-72 TaxID=3051386 RepID=UPI00265C17A9|nr:hypothetical protein [Streptomyces sp. DG2A-72]MDO0931123.1 hypothetical protein [Streptomyces sp. DG2A-72]
MRIRIAVVMLWLPLGQNSRWRRRALEAVLRAADSGERVALRAAVGAIKSLGPDTVWETWLGPTVSGAASPRWWTSPLVAELASSSTAVHDVLVDAGWRDWLDEHQPELWSLLRGWNRAATTSDPRLRFLSRLALGDDGETSSDEAVDALSLARAAVRFDHPIGERARAKLLTCGESRAVDLFCATAVHADAPHAVAFCRTHHLAPANAAERAAFFLRTGQHEQYRALDPDGALLAVHYRDAPSEERSALREAMTRLGGIDILRVLAGQRRRDRDVASLNHKERAYLTGQFTRQRDWDQLWPFTVLLPLADAVRVVHAFGDWRPSGADDRSVFETLLAAGPVTKQVKALSTGLPAWDTPHTRIALRDLDERATDVVDLDFAPDGRGLAFASPGKCAGIVDLGSTTLSRLYHFTGATTRVAQLGPDTVVVAESARDRGRTRPGRTRLQYCDSQGRHTLSFGASRVAHVRQLRRTAGDRRFIVLSAQGRAEDGEWTLFTGEADGPLVDTGMFSGRNHPGLTATLDPEGRIVAVLDERTAVLADLTDPTAAASLRNSTAAAGDSMPHVAMSPSLLVRGNHQGRVQVWREPLTSRKAPVSKRLWQQQEDRELIGLSWSPALQRLLALSRRGLDIAVHLPRLKVLGTPPSDDGPVPGTRVPKPIPLASAVPGARPFMRLSPRGDVLAMGGVLPGHIDLYALSLLTVRPFIGKPMGLMRPRDLTAVVTVLENPVLDEESRTTLTLLRTCLEHRFRHDVWLGDTQGTAVAGDHEIELGW